MMSANPALSGSYAPGKVVRSPLTAIALSYAALDLRGCITDCIFEPFFTPGAEGIGMGLSISRSIIESHGGRLGIGPSSTGALFEFTLPSDAVGAS
jgi:hypothetical protein